MNSAASKAVNAINYVYNVAVPEFVDQQIRGITNEFVSLSKIPFYGVKDFRYNGSDDAKLNDEKGIEFLKSRASFVPSNKYSLLHCCVYFIALTNLGLFLLRTRLPSSVGIAVASIGFVLTAGTIHEYVTDNKLKRALEYIIPQVEEGSSEGTKTIQIDPPSFFKPTKVSMKKEDVDGDWNVAKGVNKNETVMYLFKFTVQKAGKPKEITIDAYYFGSGWCARTRGLKIQRGPDTSEGTSSGQASQGWEATYNCKMMLEGNEISKLINIARPAN